MPKLPTGLMDSILGGGANVIARVRDGIRAYHGSPYDFDKFDVSKIGTGEGAQAYGHGLYFAENEGVARDYRNRLSGVKIFQALKSPEIPDFMRSTAKMLLDRDGSEAAVAQLREIAKKYPDERGAAKAAEIIESSYGPGRMYEVNINAHPDQFLDWDKLPVQQAPSVRRAIDEIMRPLASEYTAHPDLGQRSMQSVIWDMGHPSVTGSHAKASAALREAGVPGIRYLDQGSRAVGDGSRNYVVNDDSLIEILRKYGLAGLPAAGVASGGGFGALAPDDGGL